MSHSRPPAEGPGTDVLARLRALGPNKRRRALAMLGTEEGEAFDRAWPEWAHAGQVPPEGDAWRIWVLMAGRGFGKTWAGAKWITEAVAGTVTSDCPHSEPLSIALVGATLEEARRVMVEGRSGLLEVASGWIRDWNPSLRKLKFRTGAEAVLFSGASPDQLRGPEHHLAWCDELAKWEKPQETWDMLQFGLRAGPHPRVLVTTTPRPGPVLRAIMAEPDCVTTGGPTRANPHNSPAWRRAIQALYAGTRLGRQELDGELLTDAPGALWTVELLERCRLLDPPRNGEGDRAAKRRGGGVAGGSEHGGAPTPPPAFGWSPSPFRGGFTRIVIAVDPPSGDGTCGIIACAKDGEGRAHVLADHSVTARTPEGWARAVADAVSVHSLQSSPGFPGEGDHAQHGGGASLAVTVVAEQNQGGKMVAAVLRTADPSLKVKLVTATVGKAERAAPVAMLFEAGKVVLHGRFPELEAELLGMIAGGVYEGPGVSPDRADAMVWGLTELMLAPEQIPPRVRQL